VHADCKKHEPAWIVTDMNSAELIKHASNSFLAMKISFINMVADLCEAVGADVGKVRLGMGMDPRIGPAFLNPGLGFGGFCFPKDVQAFVRIASKAGCDFSLLKEVENINKHRVEHFVEKLRKELWVLRGRQIAVLGLAFKPNTDDIRFAPALDLLRALAAEGVNVTAYDPQAAEKTRAVLPDVRYCASPFEAAENSDAIVIATEWAEFKTLDWDHIRTVMARPLVVDGRNMFDPAAMAARGFHYISTGRQATSGMEPAAALPAQSSSSAGRG
jgi:UDPglucose 6-dehydrogenase